MENTMIPVIIATLNHVEVRGKENLDRLLAAIVMLERLADTQKGEEEHGG